MSKKDVIAFRERFELVYRQRTIQLASEIEPTFERQVKRRSSRSKKTSKQKKCSSKINEMA